MNAGRPPFCRYSVRMSGVFGHRFGRKNSRHLGACQLGEVLGQLHLRVAPREVRVRLREAELGQPVHHLRPGERLGQEDHLRMLALDARDHPLPERRTPWCAGCRPGRCARPADPVANTLSQLLHSACQSSALEVERVDVLVLLRRVLGVLDRAVRAVRGTTPGAPRTYGWSGEHWNAMSSAISMPCSRRAVRPGGGSPPACRAPGGSPCGRRPRRHRRSPTGCRRRPGRRRRRCSCPCGARADRVDRRQVEDVEAHLRDVRQPRLDVVERAVAARLGRRPSAGTSRTRRRSGPAPGRRALVAPSTCGWRSDDRDGGPSAPPSSASRARRRRSSGRAAALAPRLPAPLAVSPFAALAAPSFPASLVALSFPPSFPASLRLPPRSSASPESTWAFFLPRVLGGALGGGADQSGTNLEVDRHVLPGLDALPQVAPPGLEGVDPRLDGVTPREPSR